MASIKETIREKIQKTKHHPFLFVGSGFSYRYMHTERWQELLEYICTLISENPLLYASYADRVKDNDYYDKQPKIAELMESDFNKAVYENPAFEEFRRRHIELLKSNVSPFKIEIADHLSSCRILENTEEIEMLKKLSMRSIPGIITTNYDTLLEQIFSGFTTFVGQEELIFANISGIGEIYKIHGSVTSPKSIIITASDYADFEKLSAYLVAKILTIFIEYPVIFIGYSINDRNILKILKTIAECLSQEKLEILKDRFIFIDYNDAESISTRSVSFEHGKSITMTQVSTKNFLQIYEAIYAVKSTYSPIVLRQLRKDIYNMSLEDSLDKDNKITAIGFENLDRIDENSNFILGVGKTSRNGHLIKAEQLYEDVIRDNQYLDPKLVVEEYLPELLKRNSGGLPMFKYLQVYPEHVFGAVKERLMINTSVDSFLNTALRKSKQAYRCLLGKENLNVAYVIKREGRNEAYKKLNFLEAEEINTTELCEYISDLLGDSPQKMLKNNSELKRLIRIYDFLKYKNTSSQNDQ